MDSKKADKAAREILPGLFEDLKKIQNHPGRGVSSFKILQKYYPGIVPVLERWCQDNGCVLDDIFAVCSGGVYYYTSRVWGGAKKQQVQQVQQVQVVDVLGHGKQMEEKQVAGDEKNGFHIEDENIKYVSREIHGKKDEELLAQAWNSNPPTPILLVGPTGVGKSAMIRYFCAKNGIRYYRVSLSGGTDVMDLIGGWAPNANGGFEWTDGVITRFARIGGCLVLDEINACPPEILFVLHSLLDDDRRIVLTQKGGEVVKAHPRLWVVATMNEGAEYIGARPLNPALRDRFLLQLKIEVDNGVEEALIKTPGVIKLAEELRRMYNKGMLLGYVSTRQLIALEKNMRVFGVEVAFQSFITAVCGGNELDAQAVEMLAKLKDLLKDETF